VVDVANRIDPILIGDDDFKFLVRRQYDQIYAILVEIAKSPKDYSCVLIDSLKDGGKIRVFNHEYK
jgi:hypothetical protein